MKPTASIALLALSAILSSVSLAQDEHLLTVNGEAEVEVAPDFVRLEVLVTANDAEVDDAKEDVDARTREAVKAIEAFDVSDEDLSFSGVRVDREYKYDRNDNERLIGYSVSRTITIKLRDFDKYEQLVHLLVEAGIDELQGVSSDVDDESVLERAALEGAAKAAKLKAEAIASGLGISLGMPVEVGESGLMPSLNLRQRAASDMQLEEIAVTANALGIADPMQFVPENIKVRGVVWVRFEILSD